MKKLFILLTFVCFTGFAAYAQIDSSHYTILAHCSNLDSLSNAYFDKGDEQFLVIDAYKDGLIRDRSYHMVYREGRLTLNGHTLPSGYLDKLHRMMKKLHPPTRIIHFVIGPGLPLQGPAYVDGPQDRIERSKVHTMNVGLQEISSKDSVLISSLIKDKLINTAKDTHIRYNHNGVWIGNQPVDHALAMKYLPVLEQYNNVPAPGEQESYAAITLSGCEIGHYSQLRTQ